MCPKALQLGKERMKVIPLRPTAGTERLPRDANEESAKERAVSRHHPAANA